MQFAVAMVIAYLLGSIPVALIIAKAHHIDLRSIGSGNIGATNLSRALGKKWGYVCFLLDALKGFIPMVLIGVFFKPVFLQAHPSQTVFLLLWLTSGIAAVLGHVFPIYAGFKGGKGVATSFGVALGLWPYFSICALLSLVIWIGLVLAFRYISLASIVAAIAFPVILLLAIMVVPDWKLSILWPLFAASGLIPITIVVRHRENVKRILAGTESKIKTGD